MRNSNKVITAYSSDVTVGLTRDRYYGNEHDGYVIVTAAMTSGMHKRPFAIHVTTFDQQAVGGTVIDVCMCYVCIL